MRTRYLILCQIALVLLSCSDKNRAVDEVALKGGIVKINVNEGKWAIGIFGDYIYAKDHNFHLYAGRLTKSEWQKAERVFEYGQGHDKFGKMTISQGKDGALYVLNHTFDGAKVTSLTKIQQSDNIATIKDATKWEKYDLSQLSPFWQSGDTFVVLSDSTILTTGAPTDDKNHILSIINFKNQTVIPLDYWPEDGIPNNWADEKWMVYTSGSGISSNDKDRFLYWDDSGKFALIFTIDGTHANILKRLYVDRLPIPNYDRMRTKERIYCCADKDWIYMLHRNSYNEGMAQTHFLDSFLMGNTVEVFNWDGVKSLVIHLDKFGRMIMLSKDSKTLFLYSDYMIENTDAYMYSYDLNCLNNIKW